MFNQLKFDNIYSLSRSVMRVKLRKITAYLLADLKNQPVGSSWVTHILPFCCYFKGQEQIGFKPTSWHLVTYNFL